MSHFSISDGNMMIACPDRYLADQESPQTVVIWDPEHIDLPIRVTVHTVTPKDPHEYESQRWAVIEKARRNSVQPKVFGNKAVYSYSEPSTQDGFFMYFSQVGMGNHCFIFSITTAIENKASEALNVVHADLERMIESIAERKEGEQFDCCLQESEKDAIRNARTALICDEQGDAGWKALQAHYDAALIGNPPEDSGKIGYVFGELLREEIPAFHWKVKIDEWGRARALDFAGAKISIFPESMIWKRLERKESLNLRELSSGTIETVEGLYRKYQEEAE